MYYCRVGGDASFAPQTNLVFHELIIKKSASNLHINIYIVFSVSLVAKSIFIADQEQGSGGYFEGVAQ